MSHLLRSSAPVSDAGWRLLDEEAKERLAPALAARKLVTCPAVATQTSQRREIQSSDSEPLMLAAMGSEKER